MSKRSRGRRIMCQILTLPWMKDQLGSLWKCVNYAGFPKIDGVSAIVRHHSSSRRRTATTSNSREATRTGNLFAINSNRNIQTSRTKGGWHAACELVVGETQPIQLGHESKLGWNRTRQFVVLEIQICQLVQESKLGWNRTSQLVVAEIQLIQLGHTKLGWNRTHQLVAPEIQSRQLRQHSNFDWDPTGKVVATKKKCLNHGFLRTQVKVLAVPIAFIYRIQPSTTITPIATIRAVIKGCQSKSLHQTII